MQKRFSAILLLLAVHLWLLFNLRFTAWPEMLAYPYLHNNGFLLYQDMIHPYPPLLTLILSYIYSIAGYSIEVLKSVAWLNILLADILIYFIVRQLTENHRLALVSLLFYVFVQPFLKGNMLWFDLAIMPPLLLGLFFLLRKNLFWAGLFLGAAALIKQTAGVFWLLAIGYLILTRVQWLKMRQLLVGPLLLVVPLLIRLWQEGALEGFFNWVILYPVTEWGKYPGYVQMALSGREWSIIGLLLLPLLFGIWQSRKILADKNFQLLILFLVGALISVYPRFSFFHSQLALAVLVISYGHLLGKLDLSTTPLHRSVVKAKIRKLSVVCSALFIIFVPLAHIPTIKSHWQKETRFYGSADKELAQLVAVKVKKDEKVFLLGLPAGLYVMADRTPPKPWTDNFGWYLEIPGVQEEVISRWQENPPAVVFWREPSPGNWFDLGTYQPKKIVAWITGNYTKKEEIKPRIWLWELVLSE